MRTDLRIVAKSLSVPREQPLALHYYVCGPVRATREEAERDAELLAEALAAAAIEKSE